MYSVRVSLRGDMRLRIFVSGNGQRGRRKAHGQVLDIMSEASERSVTADEVNELVVVASFSASSCPNS